MTLEDRRQLSDPPNGCIIECYRADLIIGQALGDGSMMFMGSPSRFPFFQSMSWCLR